MKKYDRFKSAFGIQKWENVKNVFWKLPLPEREKRYIYNFLRDKARGKVHGLREYSVFQTYVEELLEQQSLNNSFSAN